MAFCDRLKMLRKAQKMSQAELAQISGLSQSAISAFEKGVNEPSSVSIQQLSKALGMTPGELLGDSAAPATGEGALTPQERQLLEMFRHLNPVGKSTALGLVESLLVQFGEKNNPSRSVSNK